jgi:hypothetical protein
LYTFRIPAIIWPGPYQELPYQENWANVKLKMLGLD